MKIKRQFTYKSFVNLVLIFVIIALYFNFSLYQTAEVRTNSAIKLPIVMYHHFLKDSKAWGKYVISPDEFEMDLVYIKKKGYTTVDMQDLINYVYNDIPLPEKPIMLTFDDGYLSQVEYILPILKKYNCKAIISIVGIYTDTFTESKDTCLSYAYLSWGRIKDLVKSDYIEIQNHSYDLHKIGKRKGVGKKFGETYEKYKQALNNDILYMQNLIEKNVGYRPTTFTYPFGEMSDESETILKDIGFLATLSCAEGVNYITKNKEDLYKLKRCNRPYKINREKFFDRFD
ncbi:polysaccharide deacetylase family protein [Sedimentibacter sp. zth1]|uniref:polysaccharide deacetylase family protein n=1 Tax=Sedimentibacter sp. zth1 TaxID=2816908 RepID=UPI001A92D99D|nr:polysaccharide deacetylase family protein [Sedimentibacter sp. zth1]QSX05207.1 polysaccharide deacetylase family protein [Sedimentibacter sp. zth1]